MLSSIRLAVALCMIVTPLCVATAQDVSPYLRSTWNTVYEAPSGFVHAIVKIDGETGTYTLQTAGAQPVGQLSGIRFIRDFNHQALGGHLGPPTNAIVGRWQLYNSSGYFVFREPDSHGDMDGYFGSFLRNGQLSQVHGSWDGKLIELRPEPPRLEVGGSANPTPAASVLDLPGGSQEAQALQALPVTSEEQVTGKTTDIIPISFLREGLEKTPGIGQLRVKEDARPLTGKGEKPEIKRRLDPLATCFMISESLAMTAYHVYKRDPAELLPKMEIKFEAEEGDWICPIIREELVLKDLDVAILRTGPSKGGSNSWLRLNGAIDGSGNIRIVAEEGLQMLHFPANFPGLRLTVHNSFYRERNFQQPALEGVNIDHLLIYTTDTDYGSSGAPLMNSSWQLIAVHLGPVTIKDEKLNRGVRADSIVQAIRNADKAELLAEILGDATKNAQEQN